MKKDKISEILITNSSELKQWAYGVRRFQSSHKNYRFNLQGFTPEENQKISMQVNRHDSTCGCKTGGLLMSLTFMVLSIYYFISGGTFSNITLKQILWLIGLSFAGALVGKGIGILQSKWKLIKLSHKLLDNLNQSNRKKLNYGTHM